MTARDKLLVLRDEAIKRSQATTNELRDRVRSQNPTVLVAPALVGEIDPYAIGVHPSELAAAHSSGSPYVGRAIDATLDQRIEACWNGRARPLVVVAGTHTSGKSRTLWEALARVVPDATMYAVRPPRRSDLTDTSAYPIRALLEQRGLRHRNGTVIWIDDAHEHLNHGLDGETLTALCSIGRIRGGRSQPVIVVTDHADRAARRHPGAGSSARAATCAPRRRAPSSPSSLTRTELADARRRYPRLADDPLLERLPEWFAAVNLIRERYGDGRDSEPRGIAVARAAIMWRRAGMPPAVDRFALHELSRGRAPDRAQSTSTSTSPGSRGPCCGRASRLRTGRASCAACSTARSASTSCTTRWSPISSTRARPCPPRCGSCSCRRSRREPLAASPARPTRPASSAPPSARSPSPRRHPVPTARARGSASASSGIARATSKAPRSCYQRAIETGSLQHTAQAALNLGLLRDERGDLEGAASAYQQAITSGLPEHTALGRLQPR